MKFNVGPTQTKDNVVALEISGWMKIHELIHDSPTSGVSGIATGEEMESR